MFHIPLLEGEERTNGNILIADGAALAMRNQVDEASGLPGQGPSFALAIMLPSDHATKLGRVC
jgi:hypothetical protein